MIQRSQEWYDARMGKFTASSVWKLFSKPRSKSEEFGATAMSYIIEKVCEIISGEIEQISSKYLDHGRYFEPFAFRMYKSRAANPDKVIECGFFTYDADAGASPDGLIGPNGILEIKCPYTISEHLKYLQFSKPEDLLAEKKEYYYQMQMQMLATDRDYGHFVTYSPFTHPYNMKVLVIPRDETVIEEMKELIKVAAKKRDEIVENIKSQKYYSDSSTEGVTRDNYFEMLEFEVL